MRAIWRVVYKLIGLVTVIVCWQAVADSQLPPVWAAVVTWGLIALVPIAAIVARKLLDASPTKDRATQLTIPLHYIELILLGCASIAAYRLTQASPWIVVPVPKWFSTPALLILGVLALLTVVNLGIRGFGLPFAAVQSHKLATDWLYERCRNPMGLTTLLFMLAAAIWLQSLHAILWTLLWLTPAWVLFVRLYEERELEVRFGEPYLAYKARTRFF